MRSKIFYCICLVPGLLLAQEPAGYHARPVSFLLGLGLTFGGETLASVPFTDGSTSSIRSGGLLYFKGGVDWDINRNIALQGTFGYHGDWVSAENGSMTFQRDFYEGLVFFKTFPRQRFGLGVRETFNAKVSSSGAARVYCGEMQYKNNTGFVFEYEWINKRGPSGIGFTIRYVNEKYKVSSIDGIPVANGQSFNGNHFGLGVNWYI